MSDGDTQTSRWRVVRQLATLFLVLLSIDGCFWFVVDFGAMVPASEGSFAERLYFTIVSALGPLAWVVHGFGVRIRYADDFGAIALSLGLLAVVTIAVRYSPYRWLRLPAMAAILVWFAAGCLRTSLRIT
jgi:hypothetical protein